MGYHMQRKEELGQVLLGLQQNADKKEAEQAILAQWKSIAKKLTAFVDAANPQNSAAPISIKPSNRLVSLPHLDLKHRGPMGVGNVYDSDNRPVYEMHYELTHVTQPAELLLQDAVKTLGLELINTHISPYNYTLYDRQSAHGLLTAEKLTAVEQHIDKALASPQEKWAELKHEARLSRSSQR